jgi:hypothetical protein
LRGNGNKSGPKGCYIAGITSCFIATFVSVIPDEGIKLKLNVNAESSINFSKHLLLQMKQVMKYNFESILKWMRKPFGM